MLSILCVILTIKVKVGIPESFKVRWYPLKKTGSSHLKSSQSQLELMSLILITKVYLGILVTKVSNDFKMTTSKNWI